jgi:outer membrane receptor protein involved in Fe transport
MSKSVSKSVRLSTSMLAIALAICVARPALAEGKTYDFHIPAEGTAKALIDFSRQANVQIVFPAQILKGRSSAAISGQYDRSTVLKMLLDGTGLEVATESDVLITLRTASPEKVGSAENLDRDTVVVVTGTHIRGGNPTSPVQTISRKDIDRTGYSQIGDLMRSLPSNFSGGQNPGVIAASATNVANANTSNASTVNLRGLGTDATLVLLNGHRLAADSSYQGSDISGIPLAAVKRIDVVTDGASALYGSDAVAGVVNILLRRNFSGGQLSARVGGASQGGGVEHTYTALAGVAKSDWYLLANAEVSSQSAITAAQRDATSGAPPVTTLWQPQDRKSLFLSGGRDFNQTVSLAFDGMISDRNTTLVSQTSSTSYVGFNTTYTPAYAATATLDVNLPADYKLQVIAGASGSRNRNLVSIPQYAYTSATRYKNDVQYAELDADGALLRLPSGDVKVAAGLGVRSEGFQQNLPGSSSFISATRTVSYGYGEVLAPLVIASDTRLGLHELELSLAGRAEHYSDFGSSSNPRIGFRYVPAAGVTVRGTWGKSFKAPSFSQMYTASGLYLYPATSAGYTGGLPGATMILVYGGNAELKPEKSTSWTLGADYKNLRFSNLRLSATAFHIDYTDRVVQPVANLVAALSNSIYAPFVVLMPTSADQSALLARVPKFTNYSGHPYDPSNVVAVVNNNYQNATAQAARGLDVSYRQTFQINDGVLDAFADGTWLHLEQQTIQTLPDVVLSGTIFNPADFKARGGLAWMQGGWAITGIANYIDKMSDTVATPHRLIKSWTTIDATLAYHFTDSGLARGLSATLSIANLFDRDPPRALSPSVAYQGIYYDSTNASIVGRFVSLTINKSW